MTDLSIALDRNGEIVRIGDEVRIVGLSQEWLDLLDPDYRRQVRSMNGKVYEIDEIDPDGRVWVTGLWPDETGLVVGRGVPLGAEDMVRVD